MIDQSNAQLDHLQSQRFPNGTRPRAIRIVGKEVALVQIGGHFVRPARGGTVATTVEALAKLCIVLELGDVHPRAHRRHELVGVKAALQERAGGHVAERSPYPSQGDVQAVARRLRGSIRPEHLHEDIARHRLLAMGDEIGEEIPGAAAGGGVDDRPVDGEHATAEQSRGQQATSTLPARALLPVIHRSPARLQYALAYQRVHAVEHSR